MSRTVVSIVVCACMVVASARVAGADEDPQVGKARVHLRAGIADYDEGRYDEAAQQIEEAYAIKPLPDLQYNLAQCYERLGRLEDAEHAYQAYLAGKVDAPDRVTVQKRIASLDERMRASASGNKAAVVPEEKVVFKTLVVYREVPPPPGRAARWAAYTLGALGVAGLACGVTFAVLTAQASSAVRNGGNVANPPLFDGAPRDKQEAAHLYPIGTGVGFGVAALAIGGGIGLFVASRKIDREAMRQREEQAHLPALSPFYARSGGATVSGLALAGRF